MPQVPPTPQLYLASTSPRRRELLEQLGVSYALLPVEIDETPAQGEAADDYVMRMALAKARSGWRAPEQQLKLPVMGADTAVICDRQILGKPAGPKQALAMLRSLSGRSHEVYSAVCLAQAENETCRLAKTRVYFRELAAEECERYCRTGEPYDKAGGYAIQGFAAAFVSRIEGSYSTVMGLPLYETAELLAQYDVAIWGGEHERRNIN